jgi:hypothetical protein
MHGKAPIGTHPRLIGPHHRHRATGHHEGIVASLKLGQPRSWWCLIILTVLKRSVVGWVKEATR